MTNVVLDRVLMCRTLPSLPMVAVEVLDRTSDPNVTAEALAEVIQKDPALTTRLLRTVNSSYYGLAKPCASIKQAVGLLGVAAVKSLALSFSLVDVTRGSAAAGFDMVAYWQRAVYGAAAARMLAQRDGAIDPEEAFVAALLQDIGMLAIRAALGEEYDAVLAKAGQDHWELSAFEKADLGFDHAEVGAELANRWRLPGQVVAATRYHVALAPETEPHWRLARVVRLAGLAALALSAAHGPARLAQFREAASAHGLDTAAADEFIARTVKDGAQLSSLLRVSTGAKPDVAALLAEAHERLVVVQEQTQAQAATLAREKSELVQQVSTDALTGLLNRRSFDADSAKMFSDARRTKQPLSVAFCDADRFKSINDRLGHAAGDAVLVEIAARLRAAAGARARVYRYGGEEFAVLMPGIDSAEGVQIAEAMRAGVESRPMDLAAAGRKGESLGVTISVGVSTMVSSEDGVEQPRSSVDLVKAADEALYGAKAGGRNRVQVAAQAGAVAQVGGEERWIMIVEDDALSARLLEAVLTRTPGVTTSWIRSGEDALRALGRPGEPRPDMVIADVRLGLGTGVDLVKRVRGTKALAGLPVILISADDSPLVANQARAAGATAFYRKSLMCADMAGWVSEVLRQCEARAAA